jgi:hypothetical protein
VRARFFVFAVIVGMAVALFVNGLGTDHRDLVLRQGGNGQALDLRVEGSGPPTAAAPGEVADVFTGDLFPTLAPLPDTAPAQIVLAASVGRLRRGNGGGGGGHAPAPNLVALLAPLGNRGGAGSAGPAAGSTPLIAIGPSPTTSTTTSTTVAPPADTTTTTKKPRPPKTTTTTSPTTTSPTTTTPPTTTTEPPTTTTEPTTTTTESTTTTTT